MHLFVLANFFFLLFYIIMHLLSLIRLIFFYSSWTNIFVYTTSFGNTVLSPHRMGDAERRTVGLISVILRDDDDGDVPTVQ